MLKNNKPKPLAIPGWLQVLFMLALLASVFMTVVFSALFLRNGIFWSAYITFVPPLVISLAIFILVLNKQKPLLQRIFLALLFYEIANLIGVPIFYISRLIGSYSLIFDDIGLMSFFIFSSPLVLFTAISLFLVYKYREQIRAL